MRNQSIVGSKLPDLSEAAEQEKGNSLYLPSCSCKTESTLSSTFSSVAKGVYFQHLRENLFQAENDDDDLFLCYVPPCQPFASGPMTEKLCSFSISRWHDL